MDDFFSWVSSEVSDGVDWLFKGNNLLNAGVDAAKLFSGSQSTAASKALMNPPKAQEQSVRGRYTSTQVASGRPAQVHTLDKPLFSEQDQDPWMYTFRSVVNRASQQAGP